MCQHSGDRVAYWWAKVFVQFRTPKFLSVFLVLDYPRVALQHQVIPYIIKNLARSRIHVTNRADNKLRLVKETVDEEKSRGLMK
jgi:hypothetical protein